MRFFRTDFSLNENLRLEIEYSVSDAINKIGTMPYPNDAAFKRKIDLEQDYVNLIAKQEVIVNAYYDDLKKSLKEKLAVNTLQINSIHIGKYQVLTLLDFLMIEGTLNGINNMIMSAPGFTDMKSLTHNSEYGEMRLLTCDFLYKTIKESPNIEESMGWDFFNAMVIFYDHITRLYLHLAIDKLYQEGLFSLHLKNRPFHVYYGEPNSYYYSIYFIDK